MTTTVSPRPDLPVVSRLNVSYRRAPWLPAPLGLVAALALGCLAASPSAAQTRPDSIPATRNAAVADSEIVVDLSDIVPPVSREFRGVWVVSVGNMDWPSRPGLPVEQQKSELIAI